MKHPALLLLIGALALAGCGTRSTLHADPAVNPLDAWAARVQVQTQVDEVKLAAHATGLSENQKAALSDFVARWAAAEGGTITIQSPVGGVDPARAHRASSSAQAFLIAGGAPESLVRVVGYDAAGAPGAPVVVSFLRHVAEPPRCGRSWENLTATADNIPYDNFGCALNANIAAQVANPGDLVTPRQMTPADAARRSTVFDQYRAGALDADAESAKGGQVSQVVTQ